MEPEGRRDLFTDLDVLVAMWADMPFVERVTRLYGRLMWAKEGCNNWSGGRLGVSEALALVVVLFSFGDLPVAMGWTGEVLLGPAPYVFLPLGPVGISFGGEAMPSFRVRLLSGPTIAWVDIPHPGFRLGIGRALGPVLLALVWEPPRAVLSWEIPLTPCYSVFGALGGETFLGLRARTGWSWVGGLIRGGDFSLWSGFYF